MIETARARASRDNGKLSRGPRTTAGKTRSAKNATRHGLSIPIELIAGHRAGVDALAQQICAGSLDIHVCEAVKRIAQAQLNLQRIRRARLMLLKDPKQCIKPPKNRSRFRQFSAILKMVDRALAVDLLHQKMAQDAQEQERHELNAGIGALAIELLKLDRYERRAFSRGKNAMRVFDALMLSRQGMFSA